MSVESIKNELELIFNRITNYEENYITNLDNFKQIINKYDLIESDYKNIYIESHNKYYSDLKDRLSQFKTSYHYKVINILKKNPTLKKKINKEIKLEAQLKKMKICDKKNENSLFTQTRLYCKCKYSLFSHISYIFSDLNVSIETLLEPVFTTLLLESPDDFSFLENENKIQKFLDYLLKNSDKLNEILQRIALLIENKSLITIKLDPIIKNLKAKYKTSNDFVKKLKDAIKKEETDIKKKNSEVIFEYEL